MKNKVLVILTAIFLSVIFFTQLKLINRPVTDNDEGIYLTSFLLVDKGYQAYKKTYFSQPPGFLLSVYPGFILFGKKLQAARLTVSLWSMIGFLAVIWLGFELKNKWTGLLAVSLLLLTPSYFNQSLTFQSDVLITTFSLISLAALIRFGKNFNLLWFIISSFFLNLAFWTKFDITFFPSFFLAIFLIYKDNKFFYKKIINLVLIFFSVSLVFFVIFIFPFGINQVFNNSILLRFQAASTSTSFSLFYFLKKDIILSVIILGSLFFSYFKNKDIRYPLIVIYVWGIFVLAILYFYRPLFPHHLVILTVPTVLLFSQLINLLLNKDEKILKIITIILLIVALSNRIYVTTKTSSKLISDQQQNAVRVINEYTNIGDFVVSDEEILNSISGRLPPPELSDISQVRIKSNNLSPENFKLIIDIYKPKLIIPWNGRLESIKNFKENLLKYKILTSFSSSKNIYIRIDK